MRLRICVACVLMAAVLSACGSGTPPSAGNPALLAPNGSIVYLELTVRPQGSLRDGAESALTRLIGHSPDPAIQGAVGKALKHAGLTYGDLGPWLGQRIAVVVKSLSANGTGVIAPTNNPGAGLRALRRVVKRLTAASYRGVRYQIGQSGGVPLAVGKVGQNVVLAAPSVFQGIVDAYRGRSLDQDPAFSAAMSALPPDALMRGYVNAAGLAGALRAVKLRGTYSFSLSAAAHSFTLQLHSSSPSHGALSDVSGLPEQSWLAVASASFDGRRSLGPLVAQLSSSPLFAPLLAQIRRRDGIDIVRDLIPALGPFELSVQGTSLLGLGAGIAIDPPDLPAATRLLATIRRLLARSSSLSVQGGSRSFNITKRGLPIPRGLVALVGRQIVATVDESVAQLLTPSSHLASNPDFDRARSALPPDSHASVFIDFRALAQLLQHVPGSAGSRGSRSAGQVLQRLDYLMAGSDPAGNTRLVLGLR